MNLHFPCCSTGPMGATLWLPEFATSLRQQKAGHHEQWFHSRSFDERYDYQSQLQTEISQRTSITAGSVCIRCDLYLLGWLKWLGASQPTKPSLDFSRFTKKEGFIIIKLSCWLLSALAVIKSTFQMFWSNKASTKATSASEDYCQPKIWSCEVEQLHIPISIGAMPIRRYPRDSPIAEAMMARIGSSHHVRLTLMPLVAQCRTALINGYRSPSLD